MTGPAGGWTMLMGGSGPQGMDRRLVHRFVELAGGPGSACLAIVPTASEEPAKTVERYAEAFRREDVRDLEVLDVRSSADADRPEMLASLSRATGVVFTGGDQLRLLYVLERTRFADELRRRARSGLLVGGSSAGAMALGDPVIVRGEPAAFFKPGVIRQAPGLGIAAGVTVDTHLVARGRLVRLFPVVAARPDVVGLGIDEDCGLTISPDGVVTVLGDGVVCVVDGAGAASAAGAVHTAEGGRAFSVTGLTLHVLSGDGRFDLRARRVLSR